MHGMMRRVRPGAVLGLRHGWCTRTGCYSGYIGHLGRERMKIISCMKPVPDPQSRLIINETKTWIRDQDLTFVASEADNYALEEALRLKEKHGGGVVVAAIGGEEAPRALLARPALDAT